jgi:hypothetical protein
MSAEPKKLFWEEAKDTCKESIYAPFAGISRRASEKYTRALLLVRYLEGATDWYDQDYLQTIKDLASSSHLIVKDPASISLAKQIVDKVWKTVSVSSGVSPFRYVLKNDY